MCNEYAREIEMARVIRLMEEMKDIPPFEYENRAMPNDIAPRPASRLETKALSSGFATGNSWAVR